MEIFNTLLEALRIWQKDRVILLFSFIPLIVGITLYTLFGVFIFADLLDSVDLMLSAFVSDWLATALYAVVAFLLSVFLFFVINWTFVAVVSFLTAPFCDSISARVEKAMGLSSSSVSALGVFPSLWNEVKKIMLLILIALLAFAFGLVPIFAPISMVLTVLAAAYSLLDYTYARRGMTLAEIFSDFKKNFVSYLTMGTFFLILLSIPILNLVAIPFGIIYFTVYYYRVGSKRG